MPRLTRRGIVVLVIIVLLLGAAGARAWIMLSDPDEDSDDNDVALASPTPSISESVSPSSSFLSPSPSDTPSPSPTFETRADLPEEPDEYPWGDVYLRVETEENGEQFAFVYFVLDTGNERKILKSTEKCADELLVGDLFIEERFGANCYGFDTLAALQYSDPDPDGGRMKHLCWQAAYSKNQDGGSVGQLNDSYQSEGCP